MTPLPRGICSSCGRSIPIRVNGVVREHSATRSLDQLEADPRFEFRLVAPCPGSGKPATAR